MDECSHLSTPLDSTKQILPSQSDIHLRIRKLEAQIKPHGIHSAITMNTAGFRYIGENDTVCCNTCNLKVADWNKDMEPFQIHVQRSPKCSFVRSQLPKSHLELYDQENPAKRQKTDSNSDQCKYNCRLVEVRKIKEVRLRTFSHWSSRMKLFIERMVVAGFFACNVGDRVICLYCNLICQQWETDTDDPSEVHKTLSPRCPYVLSMLIYPEPSSTRIVNDISRNNVNNQTVELNNINQNRFEQIVFTTPCHATYSDITKRRESFTTWCEESLPPVDELVRAGFFYTGARNIVTCFYCSGSLQNWSATDNPITEHARWFGHCPYAKQLCGDELHRQIQNANRARQERDRANQINGISQNSNLPVSHQRQLQTNDPNMLSRLVAARLDLSNSQNLLNQNFKLSIIKRCWEDQLQLKKDDFVSDSDLLTACIILQKQIDRIQGNKENIIIPSIQMRLIRERQQAGLSPLPSPSSGANTEASQNQSAPTSSATESTTTANTKEQSNVLETSSTKDLALSNPCIICCQDERRLACLPCGHFTACVPCSHSLRTCPVCRRGIEAFVRVYI